MLKESSRTSYFNLMYPETPQCLLLRCTEISTKEDSNFGSVSPMKGKMGLSSHPKGGQYGRQSPATQDCHSSVRVKGMITQNIEYCTKDMKCNVPPYLWYSVQNVLYEMETVESRHKEF